MDKHQMCMTAGYRKTTCYIRCWFEQILMLAEQHFFRAMSANFENGRGLFVSFDTKQFDSLQDMVSWEPHT